MRKMSLLEALYSWDEFWQTVETAWEAYGDPRSLTEDNFVKWLGEEVPKAHGGYFAWPTPMAPLAYMSETDVDQLYGGQLPRGYVIYDHAHRVMGWLGFASNEELFWWLFAYVGGNIPKLVPFIQHRSAGIVHEILSTLGTIQYFVQELSTGRLPQLHPDACPPMEYGTRTLLRRPKYPFFDSQLLSPKYRKGLIPEPPNSLSGVKSDTLANYLKQKGSSAVHYNPVKELEESQQAIEAEIRNTLEHPIYKILHAVKFHRDRLMIERLAGIEKLTRQCHEGDVNVGTLLEWNWKSEQNKDLRLELAQAARVGQYRFRAKRREVANKIYKQVHAWFRQRGWPMPKCPENWREEIIGL